jgi:hypothetical protein
MATFEDANGSMEVCSKAINYNLRDWKCRMEKNSSSNSAEASKLVFICEGKDRFYIKDTAEVISLIFSNENLLKQFIVINSTGFLNGQNFIRNQVADTLHLINGFRDDSKKTSYNSAAQNNFHNVKYGNDVQQNNNYGGFRKPEEVDDGVVAAY